MHNYSNAESSYRIFLQWYRAAVGNRLSLYHYISILFQIFYNFKVHLELRLTILCFLCMYTTLFIYMYKGHSFFTKFRLMIVTITTLWVKPYNVVFNAITKTTSFTANSSYMYTTATTTTFNTTINTTGYTGYIHVLLLLLFELNQLLLVNYS